MLKNLILGLASANLCLIFGRQPWCFLEQTGFSRLIFCVFRSRKETKKKDKSVFRY